MAYVPADWEITRSTKNIRYIGDDHGGGSPSYSTVIDAHRAWQALADDASSSGDDEISITDLDPSQRQTDNIVKLINGYNIDDASSEHLYDGSIIQGSGGTEVYYDGIVNYGNADVQIQLHQDGAVITDDWWNYASAGLNADAAQGISHRFMIKTRDAGADIDGRRLLGTCRRFGKTYSEFPINGTSRGNNVLALADADDLNNATVSGTVAGWTTITNETEGYVGLDVDNDATDEYYYSEWNKATYTINQFFERMKYLTREGTSETLYGLNGELFRGITHEIEVDGGSGTWDTPEYEEVTWTGGTGQLLAVNNKAGASTSKIWIQLLSGVAPTDGQTITGTTSGADCDVDVTVTARTISRPFVGASTGTALIGSYGLGLEVTDLTSADKVFDLDDTLVTPPNYVTFTVSGLVSAEDRILVAPWDGASTDPEGNPAIETDQLGLNTTLNASGQTSIVCDSAIPVDTPSTGTVRVVLDDGNHRRVAYTSWAGSTFTTASTDWTDPLDATAGADIYISYIDEDASGTTASFTSVYSSDRDLVVVDRDGKATPIKQFISSAVLGSGGGGITVIRTSDE